MCGELPCALYPKQDCCALLFFDVEAAFIPISMESVQYLMQQTNKVRYLCETNDMVENRVKFIWSRSGEQLCRGDSRDDKMF